MQYNCVIANTLSCSTKKRNKPSVDEVFYVNRFFEKSVGDEFKDDEYIEISFDLQYKKFRKDCLYCKRIFTYWKIYTLTMETPVSGLVADYFKDARNVKAHFKIEV